jgi:hypothetical protein
MQDLSLEQFCALEIRHVWPRVDTRSDDDFVEVLRLGAFDVDHPPIRLVIALDNVDSGP